MRMTEMREKRHEEYIQGETLLMLLSGVGGAAWF